MNTPEESLDDQDPDYVSAISNDHVQRKIYEENARNTTARKITAIVEKEFSREIDLKEKEILQIQERLHKALKIFHLLRYVVITNFYNRKQCQAPQTAETTKQTRIHPAIKSLLGKCPKSAHRTDLAIPSTSTDPRFLYNDEPSVCSDARRTAAALNRGGESTDECDNGVSTPGEKRNISDEEESRPRKVPRYVPPKSSAPEKTCPSRGNSHKIRKRIIVGNISKWIPPDWRENSSSHKWTMYVRGDKDENANISAFVSKVRFFLHPSYCPNDVVEVTSYPFHLSRRGWGEFPLRVQLHFKNALNKPMDIIHHLKLDRTYTGLQMLGSETLVDVWIHTADHRNFEQNNSDESAFEDSADGTSVKMEPSDGHGFDSVCKQFPESTETSRPTAETSEKVSIKKEISNSNVRSLTSDPLSNSADLIERSENEIKVKSDDTTVDRARSTNDERGFNLEEIRRRVMHDHNYSGGRYCDSYHSVTREGNITIEHFWKDECVPHASILTNSSTVDSNEKRSDSLTICASRRFNGDVSSSNCQPLSTATSNAAEDDALRKTAVSINNTLQENDNNQKMPLSLDADNSLQARNSKSNDTYKILENTTKAKGIGGVPLTTINGFYEPLDVASLDSLRKTTVSSSDTRCDSHLKPLRISIPPTNIFASPTNKHVLVLKDNKTIPVNLTSILPSNENSKGTGSTVIDGNVSKLNVRIPQGVSILKKPFNAKVNARHQDTASDNNKDKRAVVRLTVKSTNSLLLNVNEDVPILKIANSLSDPRYNSSVLTEATRNVPRPPTDERGIVRSEDKMSIQRTKITLGKDKYKIQSKRELYETVLRSIDIANIADTEALIRFVIRRLPIVTRDAYDPEYKQLHPYACCSEEEYLAHNIGKQRALEWCRAKTIRYFLRMKSIPIDRLWSIKEIVLWARLHGYTPRRSTFGVREVAYTTSEAKTQRLDARSDATISSTSALLLLHPSSTTYTEPIALQKWLQQIYHQRESNRQPPDGYIEDEEIDVESVVEDNLRETTVSWTKNGDNRNSSDRSIDSTLIPLELDESSLPFHNFVCNTARNIGIKIGPEEIVPGVLHCAASRVIMRVVECFVEDLTRSSLARAWERNSGNEWPKVITPNDVRNALASREEFDIFTNQGLGSRQQLSTTELSSL